MRREPGEDEAHHCPADVQRTTRHLATMVRKVEKILICNETILAIVRKMFEIGIFSLFFSFHRAAAPIL
ncbi:MAG TPA: hypothetical protein DDW73_20130 [Rhizobium sp.]|nr:hypothetical protein [Rhizobium sp.]